MDRTTKRARLALRAAQDEARQLNHAMVGSEHVLLALIQDQDGIAGDVLRVFDVQLAPARSVVAAMRERVERPAPPGDIALDADAQQLLTDAQSEADALNHHYVGTEHLLLAIVHRVNGARSVLATSGAPPEEVRWSVLQTMRQGPPARR